MSGEIYRMTMKVLHKFNLHYAPPIYPDGDTQLWCKWCGFRQTIKKNLTSGTVSINPPTTLTKE